ncbi:MFS transporter [Emcibacter sp.]|uniref:MFS transporter n=1 Tax=Emcibacter sp. TaxID=1979954 RepID=UPI003A93FEB1
MDVVCHRDLKKTWPVFLASLLLFVGSGLLETVVSYRTSVTGYDSRTAGIVMTSFYVGFLFGTFLAPRLISQLRHDWTFRFYAVAVMLTAWLLGQSASPVEWSILQVLNGLSMGGIYVVIESWLNLQSRRRSRGFLFALYMMCWYAGLAMGQVSLSVGLEDLAGYFRIVCVAVGLSLVSLSHPLVRPPKGVILRPFRLSDLAEIRTTSLSGSFLIGVSIGCICGMAPVFAHTAGFSIQQVAYFCVAFIFGAAVFQFPLSWLGDRVERTRLKLFLALSCAMICLGGYWLPDGSFLPLLAGAFLIGGFSFPVYSLSVTDAYDNLKTTGAALSASAALLLVNGLGSAVGPFWCGLLMEHGNNGFFLLLLLAHLILAIHLASQIVFSKRNAIFRAARN